MKKYYLAHPFDTRHEMRELELEIEKDCNIELVNPFYDIERRDIEAIDSGKQKRYQVDHIDIVERDLAAIESSNGIIAHIGGDGFSCGTMQEIVYAYVLYKVPVILYVTNGHEEHPWLKYHSDVIFTKKHKLKEYLNAKNK